MYVWDGYSHSLSLCVGRGESEPAQINTMWGRVCVWERKTRLALINEMSVYVGRENLVLALIITMCVRVGRKNQVLPRNIITHVPLWEEVEH